MALVTVQRSPTPSTTSSPCVSSSQLEESETEVFCCQCEDTEHINGTNYKMEEVVLFRYMPGGSQEKASFG
ncbi:hypothetical protein GDO86_002916 [Hymenochirus boettgeri]|uniref:Uncharacterized protein n=1 Tax=Hymenochirus boettgeri TaxID=247094 RepID=A0A8T2JYU9_9PIPI|nr:hypothetical protein GDO86_002916 [Hymenochirus boettgeri]